MRIRAQSRSPLWFGPARGRQAIHRFDDPTGRFRVCYFGTTVEVCFAETFLRNPPVRILGFDDLARRSIATVEVLRDLQLVPIHGRNLARLGVTAELASDSNYATSHFGRARCGSTATGRTVFCIARARRFSPLRCRVRPCKRWSGNRSGSFSCLRSSAASETLEEVWCWTH